MASMLARILSQSSGDHSCGSPLVLSRVHWVEPKLVAEITYLTWTADNLLRHTVYVGLREDKPAVEVRREAVRV
jgi:ATP-dependent DNA ligase